MLRILYIIAVGSNVRDRLFKSNNEHDPDQPIAEHGGAKRSRWVKG